MNDKHTDLLIYSHPEEPSLTWTGRGRKPKWVEAWIASGRTLDQLQVRPRCDKTLELPGLATPETASLQQAA
jgi:hypothetical protein